MFLGDSEIKQVIHWKLTDLIEIETNKPNNKKKGVINRRSSFAIGNTEQKFQSELDILYEAATDDKTKEFVKQHKDREI